MIQKIYNHKSVLICVHRATEAKRRSGWLIKIQVLYEHTLAGHRQAGKQMIHLCI